MASCAETTTPGATSTSVAPTARTSWRVSGACVSSPACRICWSSASYLARDNRIEPLDALPRSRVNAGTRSTAGLEFEGLLQATAPSRLPVFLLGPSGSGKTWAARTLHDLGRKGKPFVAINCARLPHDPVQLQSFLLGHVKGAFTGADRDHVGAFFEAAGGTLFLDEVESLSPVAQGFLLDLLEESGQLRKLGSQQVLGRPDVRIVSASKADLRRSALRNDLCYRLAAGEVIRVPHLSERRDDISGLIAGFVKVGDVEDKVAFSADAMRVLVEAPWTGEVRELEGTVKLLIDRAVRSGTGLIDADDVRRRLHALDVAHGFEPAEAFDEEDRTSQDLRRPTSRYNRAAETNVPQDRNPRRLSRADVVAALEATGGNIEQAAKRVGCVRNTFTKKMDEFEIPRPTVGREQK